MITVILVIHVILAICIILAVLMQKSEGGGFGIGGSSAGGGFMTARGTANFMTKLTAFLGGCFFLTSIVLALLSSQDTPSISNEVKKTIEESPTKIPAYHGRFSVIRKRISRLRSNSSNLPELSF